MLLQKSFVKIFFFIFLINGIWNVKNYGISYDELDYRQHGFVVLNYIGENQVLKPLGVIYILIT